MADLLKEKREALAREIYFRGLQFANVKRGHYEYLSVEEQGLIMAALTGNDLYLADDFDRRLEQYWRGKDLQ